MGFFCLCFLFSRIWYGIGWDFMSATIRLIVTTNGIWIVMDGYIQDWDMWCYVMNLLFLLWHNGLTSILGTSYDQSMPSYQTPDHYSVLLLRTYCVVFYKRWSGVAVLDPRIKISIRIGSGPESKVDLDLGGDMPNFMCIVTSGLCLREWIGMKFFSSMQ